MSSNNYGSISKQQQQQQVPSQSLSKAERDLLQADRPGYGDRSKVEVAFNLVNATVGAGIMGLPYAISHAGFVTGIVASIWVAILSQLGLYIVILAGKQTGIYKYAVLVEYVMGRFGYHLLNFMIIAQAGGGVISYFICKHMTTIGMHIHIPNQCNNDSSYTALVVLGDCMPVLFERYFPSIPLLANRTFVVGIIGICCVSGFFSSFRYMQCRSTVQQIHMSSDTTNLSPI